MRRRTTRLNLDGDDPGPALDVDARKLYRLAREYAAVGKTLDYADAAERFGWVRTYYFQVVRRLRELLAGHRATLICWPEGPRELWRYELTEDADKVKAWHVNRLIDSESRMHTCAAVASSLVEATDARSAEGILARLIERSILHVEQLIGTLRTVLGGRGPDVGPAGQPTGGPDDAAPPAGGALAGAS